MRRFVFLVVTLVIVAVVGVSTAPQGAPRPHPNRSR